MLYNTDSLTGTIRQESVTADGGATAQNVGTLAARTTTLYKLMGNNTGVMVPKSNSFHLFPIPANDIVIIQPDQQMVKNVSATISDMSGKILKQVQIKGTTSLSVKELAPGCYVVNVTDGINTRSGKMVIER